MGRTVIRNNFKIAWRSLTRNRVYATINIVGLAVGMAAGLLIFLYIRFETSFDQFHQDRGRIFRVVTIGSAPDGIHYSSGVSFPVANALRIDFPQIKQVASIYGQRETQVSLPGTGHQGILTKFMEKQVYFAEPQFFKIFNFSWLAGNTAESLEDPNTVVLTESIAGKYFGNWKLAIGKTILLDNKNLLKVTGILQDPPDNTDFPLGLVISYSTLRNTNLNCNLNDWGSTFSDAYCFVVLPPGVKAGQFDLDLKRFAAKHRPEGNANEGFAVQPLKDMHYDTRFDNFSDNEISRSVITAISLIGIFLLLIACVNFINLATAQAVNRSREVGVRKVMGSNRAQLVLQYLSESFLITLFAACVALMLAALALPWLNQLLEVHLTLNLLYNVSVLSFLLVTILMISTLAGLYPALVLSGYNATQALKNKWTSKASGGFSLRKGLVIFQFCAAQILVIATLVVASEMHYFSSAYLGFNKEAILNVTLPTDSLSQTKFDGLRNELLSYPGIKDVSFCLSSPASDNRWNSDFVFDNRIKNDFVTDLKWADADYFKTYQLKLVAGHFYGPSDTVNAFVVNEILLDKLGIKNPQDAIGKYINFWNKTLYAPIVGVVKDFNSRDLSHPVIPIIMGPWKSVYQQVSIKIRPGQTKAVIGFVAGLWNKVYPQYYFKYQFLDKQIADFYAQEEQLSWLYTIFTLLAILISCLGLYGLISFMAAQRTKELGIRKVLGASVAQIVNLLSREFTGLIFIAFVIASPISYYLMHEWLQKYTYRIHLGPGIFIATIGISILLVWITMGYKAFRAAMADPVKSLKTE